jgi:hypothetical protein
MQKETSKVKFEQYEIVQSPGESQYTWKYIRTCVRSVHVALMNTRDLS